jgi:hypothetical protein
MTFLFSVKGVKRHRKKGERKMKYCQDCLNFINAMEVTDCVICGSEKLNDIIVEVHSQNKSVY